MPAIVENFDYLVKERRPDPRVTEPNKQTWFYLVPCPNPHCDKTRWLRPYDARKNQMCAFCKRSLGGKASYAQQIASDPERMIKIARDYRLANPSLPERHTMALLKQIGIEFEREFVWYDLEGRGYILDFAILHNKKVIGAIEVNGYWHGVNPKKIDRDARLLERWPAPLLILPSKTLTTSMLFENSCKVKNFTQPLLNAAKAGIYPPL